MAYIEPNTVIKFYNGVPLYSNHESTLYFDSLSAQYNYFHVNNSGILKYTVSRNSYQRVVKGKMRVELKEDDLYDCNYMAFQNTSYDDKWFYAFIIDVEYVNNNTCEITYKIDVMQTYFFDVTLKECFVEREHSATDNVGDNIVEEDIDIGEYQFGSFSASGLFDPGSLYDPQWYVVVATSGYDYYGEKVEYGLPSFPVRHDGVANPTFLMGMSPTSFMAMLKNYEDAELSTEAIINVTMFPKSFLNFSDIREHALTSESNVLSFSATKPLLNGAYSPKNKKLLTYPYNFLGVTDGSGNMGEYRYEFFRQDECEFDVYADVNTATFMCLPKHYNKSAVQQGELSHNFANALTMANLPLVPVNNDVYNIWYAQNKVSFIGSAVLGTVGGAVATVGGAISGNALMAIGGATTVVGSITNAIGTYKKQKAIPDYVKGTAGSGLGITTRMCDFMRVNIHLQEQNARIIDDYFNVYGYATKRVKVPNRAVRPHWTYTKTIGCNAIGKCPADDLKAICEIYDKGITFWKHANEYGNYSLNNSPV